MLCLIVTAVMAKNIRRSDIGGSDVKRRAKREERRGKKGEGVGIL